MPEIMRALVLFAAAGLAEIGGGWLMWQWLREGRPWPWV
jgi:small multidrug resistance family-3 protein